MGLIQKLRKFIQKIKDVKYTLQMDKRPRGPFLAITFYQLIVGFTVFVLGIAAMSVTREYPIGAFWEGLVVFILGVYRLVTVGLRMSSSSAVKQHKRKLSSVTVVLSAFCLMVCLLAAVVDGTGSYFIARTSFAKCKHTSKQMDSPCATDSCTAMILPANTCYCCYLIEAMEDECEVPLLLGKQPVFSGVNSCLDVSVKLRIMLSILTVLHVLGAILSMVSMFKTTPVLFYYKVKVTQNLAGYEKINATPIDDVEKGEVKPEKEKSLAEQDTKTLLEGMESDSSGL